MNSSNVVPPLLPPGLTYLAALPPSINMLMIGTVGSTLLVPMFVALLAFSSREMKRKPVFILNIISISAGFGMDILSSWTEIQTMLDPEGAFNINVFIAMGCLTFALPICVESILLFRLLAVYPPSRTPRRTFWFIFAPLLLLKLARVINGIITMFPSPVAAAQVTSKQAGNEVEWFLQVFDNTATSLLFLYRLQWGRSFTSMSGNNQSSYAAKLRALFWISVTNFVFPVLLSITQLIFRFRDKNYYHDLYIFFANDYVAIVGVVFATVWVVGSDRTDGTEEGIADSLPTIWFNHGRSPMESIGLATMATTRANESRTELHPFDDY
ncbi:hypothetical protein DFH07DRAFT_737759 [Mycena maculata]|uniref:Pheromone receptor n=1 Tax=Mycena maculata TaxID=230809 RepID=A0AAD7JIG5_9AGAR|nr:hypothetical protein DFH07DRAFT_737759 [Mycena maculata]